MKAKIAYRNAATGSWSLNACGSDTVLPTAKAEWKQPTDDDYDAVKDNGGDDAKDRWWWMTTSGTAIPAPAVLREGVPVISRDRILGRLMLGVMVALSSCDDDDMRGSAVTDAGRDATAAGTRPEAGPVTSGGFILTTCVPFGIFSCCAWHCIDASETCPMSIPGLRVDDDRQDWHECFESNGFTDDVFFDLLTPGDGSSCGKVHLDVCDEIVACVRGKGGLDALDAMGYPPPGSTSSCPAPPVVSADDAGDGDAGG